MIRASLRDKIVFFCSKKFILKLFKIRFDHIFVQSEMKFEPDAHLIWLYFAIHPKKIELVQGLKNEVLPNFSPSLTDLKGKIDFFVLFVTKAPQCHQLQQDQSIIHLSWKEDFRRQVNASV